ncbi:MAG: discoidin domain-containing protein, partial [bacterium]|nr:discoidin domain-containing protein [bacterium]
GTIWHTAWEPKVAKYPHWIVVDLKQSVAVKGISLLPRQDMANGRIGRYALYVSENPEKWGKPAIRGRLRGASRLKEIRLSKAIEGRYVKIEAVDAADPSHPWASLAEFDVVVEEE